MGVLVTGDLHGPTDIHKLSASQFPLGRTLTKDDYLIVAGDFGLVWNFGAEELWWRDWLENRPWTTLFVDGNHENHEALSSMPVTEWHGGLVHRVSPSVIHLMRGEVFDLDGSSVFVMGGGTSVDRAWRVPGESWWPQEMPSDEEYARCEAALEANGWQVDYVLTHDAPSRFLDFTALASGETNQLHSFLDKILLKLTYDKWFFGCYHKDTQLSTKSRCVFCDVISMGERHAKRCVR